MNKYFKLEQSEEIKYFQCKPLEETGLVIHAFTTRLGGVSNPPFNSLNLSYQTGDKEERVLENRKLISNVLNINYQSIISPRQVHRDNILVINKLNKRKMIPPYDKIIIEADSIVTNLPGIPLLLSYADCVPVLVLDPVKKTIALIHSGRKGTELEITFQTIKKMQSIFGTIPQDCLAAIFPSIGSCCYHFQDFNKLDSFWVREDNFKYKVTVMKNDELYLDLKRANYLQLIKAGLQEEKIFINEMCTVDYPFFFFSHLRDRGETGRMGAIFMIK